MESVTPEHFEAELARYLYESAEEARAVRVGVKETSEQAAIVARYDHLFTREQHETLREAEHEAPADQRERLLRLREACAGGIMMRELADAVDELENAILAAEVEFDGDTLPLRAAQAKLAVLPEYADRERLGEASADVSAQFNDRRLDLLRRAEELDAELSGDADPVHRSAELKGIDLRELSRAL